jgi:hypothetical protein
MIKSFRPNLDVVQARLAFLETISHLEHLRLTGRIEVEERDGVLVYRPSRREGSLHGTEAERR